MALDYRHGRGFTLLEVLVAMAIFAIIGLGATQLLRTIIQTHEATQARVAAFNGLTMMFARMERDLSQTVDRPVRGEYGDLRPALIAGQGPYALEFTRAGWNNPAQRPRSRLQRVAYGVSEDDELVRYFWLVLDRAEDSLPRTQILLEHIEGLRINLVNEEGELTANWPMDETSSLPRAVEVIVDTVELGEIRRLFPLVSLAAPSLGENADQSGDDNLPGDNGDGAEPSADGEDSANDPDERPQQ